MRRHLFALVLCFTCLSSCLFSELEEPPSALCNEYCSLAMATCIGDAELFKDLAECQASCKVYRDNGDDGEVRGNTVQCRIQHLTLAELAPRQHCPHGGPTGAGHCVDESECGSYCAEIQETCSFESTLQYDSTDECQNACQAFRRDGAPGILAGNTIQCRLGFLFQGPRDFTQIQRCEAAGARSEQCVEEDRVTSMPGMLMRMD
ncbi:MAG: hypothetical protein AAGI01_16140 [Myxococcota bacterium]